MTEYTRTKPWMPMACLELSMEYSSCKVERGKSAARHQSEREIEDDGVWRVAVTDLTGSVDDVALILGTLVVDALGEGTFYGWVIRFDKVIVDELDDQGSLPC